MCSIWPKPKSRNVGFFVDLSLYPEALKITNERGFITSRILREELSQRTRGQVLVRKQSRSAVKDLVRELQEYGWLQRISEKENAKTIDKGTFILTDEGRKVLQLKGREFRHQLAIQMHNYYVIPGWFIDRLWTINPQGQGEIILPSPLNGWQPEARLWEKNEWTKDLEIQVAKASDLANEICPGSFPIEHSVWISAVAKAWQHIGNWKRKRKANASGEKVQRFSPRRRLALAMRQAAVEILFGATPPQQQYVDIVSTKPPLYSRSFQVWCPRLTDLELIFYTDNHPDITGRLVFPTSVFRKNAKHPPFEKLQKIVNPENCHLWLYQPQWQTQKDIFKQTLTQTHHRISRRFGTLYVSLLDVRDEVCRQLRYSATLFDRFLTEAFRESVRLNGQIPISLETDVREDQQSGSGQNRRSVWMEGVPYSLIAIGKTKN